jgi:hypothetical protein
MAVQVSDPRLLEWATGREREYIEAIEKHGSGRAAAQVLGLNESTIRRAFAALQKKAARAGYSPDHAMTHTVPDGYVVKGVSTYYDKDGKPAAQWVKSTADQERMAAIMREACEAMAETLPREEPTEAPQQTVAELLNLYTFTDYHLGMLSWAKETGADWDLKIAERMLFDAFSRMIGASPDAKTAILSIQGDFLHSDGLLPVTPAHKNVLDQDGRFSKIVRAAIRVIRKLIRHALTRHERVHLIIAEGNHDEASSIWLRLMFAALYEEEQRLSVNDSELPFYVHQHGATMLAFHHGHKVNNEQLPLLFAAQFPEMWGATKFRYCHTGHRHHVDEKEYKGMTVTQHPTLAARDAFAARGGWIANRSAVAVTYHARFGQVGRTIVSPEMLEEA